MSQKPVLHFINSRLAAIKAEKYGPRLYNVGELVLHLPEKRKDKLKPKWEGPFIIDEVLTGGAYRMRDASDDRLESNPWNAARLRDSMPSARLFVRLLFPFCFHYLFFLSFHISFFKP